MARRVTCPYFVGRETELRRLLEVAGAASERSQFAVVSGDAGVGKTRLLDEMSARWREAGHRTASGGCIDLGGIGAGYAPLSEALRGLRSELGGGVLDEMLLDVAPALLPLVNSTGDGHQVAQGAVLAGSVALLEAIGAGYPATIVVFEDIHWADASTRDLVAFLARSLTAAKVMLVVSYRTDDVHRRHPLRPLLAELARSSSVDHVRLEGMTRSELTMVLAGVVGSVPADAVVDEVMARSQGIPFYAEELLAARGGAKPLPETLRDALLVRIARLPESSQEILREAALLGGSVDERFVAAATGRPLGQVTEALRQAVDQYLLVAGPNGCQFRHALTREVASDDLLAGQRQHLHAAAAAVLETQPDLVPVAEHVRWARLAHHWDAAEDQPHAFAASVRAAVAAEEVGARSNAAVHYQRAVDLWPRVPEPERNAGMTQAELLLRAADAVSNSGSPKRAVSLAEMALASLGQEAQPEARALVLERVGHHRWVACDEPGSGAARADAVALVAERPPSEPQALALAALGRHHMLSDRFAEAERALHRALDVAAAVQSQVARSSALSGLGFTLAKLGRLDEGVNVASEAVHVAEQHGTVDDIGRGHANLTATLLAAARCEDAVTAAHVGLEFARRAGTLATDGVLLAYGGADALCHLGRWDEAVALLAAHEMTSEGPHGTTGAVLLARIAVRRGDLDAAQHHRDNALSVARTGSHPSAAALVCAAEVDGAERHFEVAARRCGEALRSLGTSEDLSVLAQAWAVAMRIAADRADDARMRGDRGDTELLAARRDADRVLASQRETVQRFAARGVSPLPDAAADVAVTEAEHERVWGRYDADRWAAVALQWEALGFPYPAATARYREADALLRLRGSRERATEAARTAIETALRIGAGPLADDLRLLAQRGRLDLAPRADPATPAPADPFAELSISPREREVLALLALGRTNRQIAQELFISEKTASVHVTNLLRKLRVSNRFEAAAVAQRLAPG